MLSTAGSNTLSFGANASFTTGGSSSTLTVTSSVIDFGSHTLTDATTGSAIIVNSPSGALTIEAASGGTGALVSTGGNISVTPSSGLLTFQTDGGSAATIRLNTGGTGTVTTTSGSSGTAIAANTTVSSDSVMTMNVNGGTLTNNGVVAYTGSATSTNTIVLQSTSSLTFAGGNGTTTGLFNTAAASNTLEISGTTIDFGSAVVTNHTSGKCYCCGITIGRPDHRRRQREY